MAGAIGAAMALTACDSVSEPDRFVEAEIVPQRAVLIEEFTGQDCQNCPDGHQAIKDILATLGDSVVPVSIHASNLAYGGVLGLKTDVGDDYYQRAGSPALPSAVMDMQTQALQIKQWASAINNLIMQPTPFTVRAKAAPSADGKSFDIEVAYSAGEDFTGNLIVWVVENGIIRPQLNGKEYIPQYEHNHVFRAVATPVWGDAVTLKAHDPQYASYSVPIEAMWNKDNLYAVAFLYNNGGVVQVTHTDESASH